MFARSYARDDMTIDGALHRFALRPTRAGVALIEVVVTLTLLALLGAVAIPWLRPPSPPTFSVLDVMASARRAAVRDGRTQVMGGHEARPKSDHDLVITPLGSCFPVAGSGDATGPDAVWDPLRCTEASVGAPDQERLP